MEELVYVLADEFGYPYSVEAEDYLMVLFFCSEADAQEFVEEHGLIGQRIVQADIKGLVRRVAPSIAGIDTANALLAEVAADGDGGDDAAADGVDG